MLLKDYTGNEWTCAVLTKDKRARLKVERVQESKVDESRRIDDLPESEGVREEEKEEKGAQRSE